MTPCGPAGACLRAGSGGTTRVHAHKRPAPLCRRSGGPRFPHHLQGREEDSPMMTRHLESPMRILALLVYTCTAAWVAWVHQDTPWAVIHITGAIAGACAAGLAVSYAGALGEITPDDDPDQADTYMREDWDD